MHPVGLTFAVHWYLQLSLFSVDGCMQPHPGDRGVPQRTSLAGDVHEGEVRDKFRLLTAHHRGSGVVTIWIELDLGLPGLLYLVWSVTTWSVIRALTQSLTKLWLWTNCTATYLAYSPLNCIEGLLGGQQCYLIFWDANVRLLITSVIKDSISVICCRNCFQCWSCLLLLWLRKKFIYRSTILIPADNCI